MMLTVWEAKLSSGPFRLLTHWYFQSSSKVIGSIISVAMVRAICLLLSATYVPFQWTVGKLWGWTHLCGTSLHDFGTNRVQG